MKPPPTQERLKELLNYAPETGIFTWRVYRNCNSRAGSRAGTIATNGYRFINIEGCVLLARRLAWFYMNGVWPESDIDHLSGMRDDNRWVNLRVLSRKENMQNLHVSHKDSKTGFLGVSPCNGRFAAHIRFSGKNKYLGTFDTPELAHAAYVKEKRANHPAGLI
jgi:hypothetical protein